MSNEVKSAHSRCSTESRKSQTQDRCTLKRSDATGIILAGVQTWGHGALEDVACRPLLPIAGRPLIRHVVDWLRQEGIMRAVVCANSNTELLRRNLGGGEKLGILLTYYEDHMPRGPAGCARDAASATGGSVFVVAEGTIVPRVDLGKLFETHRNRKAALTIAVADPGPVDDAGRAALEPAGVYIFSPTAFEQVPATGYQDIKETLIPRLCNRGECVATHVSPGVLAPRVTGAASYLAVNMWAVQWMAEEQALRDDYVHVNDGWVHESAVVDPTAQIVGSVVVAPGCAIGPGATIIGPTTVGAGCNIEARTIISRSAIWDHCTIGTGAVVDRCILTDGTCIEAEIVVRNTVAGPRHRLGCGILDRLAAAFQPAHKRVRSIRAVHRRRVVAESDLELNLPAVPNGLPTGATSATARERCMSPPMEAESRC